MIHGHTSSRPSRGTGNCTAAILALTLVIPGAARAEQQGSDAPMVVCVVSGYDVIIYNRDTEALAAGARVDWSVPLLRMQGSHVLGAALEPDERVFLSGVLAGGGFLEPSQRCEAALNVSATQTPQ